MSRKRGKSRDEESIEAAEKQVEVPEGVSPPDATVEELRAERDDLMARLQRVSADYLNYQKRVQRDTTLAREFANEELMKALLCVLDDMERALDAARANHCEDDPLLAGMQLVHDKALETMSKFGLTVISAEGEKFDPERHSAMMQQPSADHAPQTVLSVMQKGYALKGRTIRPAAVVISKQPEETETEGSEEDQAAPNDE